jgi:hypothetical protein
MASRVNYDGDGVWVRRFVCRGRDGLGRPCCVYTESSLSGTRHRVVHIRIGGSLVGTVSYHDTLDGATTAARAWAGKPLAIATGTGDHLPNPAW